jgi:hydrogenase maturation protease
VRIIGIGRLDRGDDAAGRLVARRLRGRLDAAIELVEVEGEVTELLDALEGVAAVVIVDAVRGGAEAGTLMRFDATRDPIPLAAEASTHGLGLAEAVELARMLGRLPATVVVHGIEGGRFEPGAPLSAAVEAGLEPLTARVLEESRAMLLATSGPSETEAKPKAPGASKKNTGRRAEGE